MQYKNGGLHNAEKNILHDATALPHSRPRAGKVQRQGQGFSRHMADKRQGIKVDTWQTRFGGAAKVDTTPDTHRPRHGGHRPGHGGQSLETQLKRTQGGHEADTWRTHGAQSLEARPKQTQGKHQAGHGGHVVDKFGRPDQSGLKADTRQTHADTWREGLEVRPKQTQGKHKADTWQTRFGGAAKADSRQTPGRTWWTRGGQVLEARSKWTQGGHGANACGHMLPGAAKADSMQTQGRTYAGQEAGTWRTKF